MFIPLFQGFPACEALESHQTVSQDQGTLQCFPCCNPYVLDDVFGQFIASSTPNGIYFIIFQQAESPQKTLIRAKEGE